MAIRRILCLSTALALAPAVAPAAADPGAGTTLEPAGEEPVNAATLGTLEAILEFCARLNGRPASKDKDRAAAMLGGPSEKEVEAARASSEYRASYEETSAQLATVPKKQAQDACGAAAVASHTAPSAGRPGSAVAASN